MSLEIIFMVHIQIIVKYNITSINFSMDENIPLMENLKHSLRDIERNSPHKVMKNL